jgi:aryl-alcohol dehydrogenase-like predicted oxidoreductase
VRYAGTSNFVDFAGQGDRLSPLLALAAGDRRFPRIAVEQPRYNLLNRAEYEATLQPIALREGLGIVTYSSLASGFLAGAWRRDTPADSDRAGFVAQYRTAAGWALLDALDRMAAARDVTVAAVSLAWTLAQPGVTATLVGADAIPQLAACAPAAGLTLTAAELDELTRLSWTASTPEFVGW